MKIIDADHFYEQLKKNDLEYMRQSDLMACLKDLLDREPTVAPFAPGKLNGREVDDAYWNESVLGDVQAGKEGLKVYTINRSRNCIISVWAHEEKEAKSIAQGMNDADARTFAINTGGVSVKLFGRRET